MTGKFSLYEPAIALMTDKPPTYTAVIMPTQAIQICACIKDVTENVCRLTVKVTHTQATPFTLAYPSAA